MIKQKALTGKSIILLLSRKIKIQNAMRVSATIDLVRPGDNAHKNHKNQTLE